jgi:hypothetical protein
LQHRQFSALLILPWIAAGIAAAGSHGGVIVTMRPGYVQQARKDEVCVAPGLNVGNSTKSVNGDILTVSKLEGKSRLCSSPEKPVLAQVEFTSSPTFASLLTIELPAGYLSEELTNKEKFDAVRLRAGNKSKDVGIWVNSWNVKLYPSVDSVAAFQKSVQAKFQDAQQTPTEELTIRGATARRWVTEMTPAATPHGPRRTYVTTILQGDNEYVFVNVWTTAGKFSPLSAEMQQIAESVNGLKKADPALPPNNPAGGNSDAAKSGEAANAPR